MGDIVTAVIVVQLITWFVVVPALWLIFWFCEHALGPAALWWNRQWHAGGKWYFWAFWASLLLWVWTWETLTVSPLAGPHS